MFAFSNKSVGKDYIGQFKKGVDVLAFLIANVIAPAIGLEYGWNLLACIFRHLAQCTW